MNEARALALFLLALAPAACALLAWMPSELSGPRLLLLSLAIALAVVFGEAFRPGQTALRDSTSARFRIWIQAFAAGVVFLVVGFGAAAPRPSLLGRQALIVLTVQLAFLLVPDLGVGRLPALACGLALTTLAAFRGGALAALAVLGYEVGLVSFLVLDHFGARLAARPGAAPALRNVVAAEVSRLLAPVLLATFCFFALIPPRPHVLLGAATIDALNQEKMAPAYLQLAFFALVGAMVVHYASRMLRFKRDGKEPVTEALQAERGVAELIAERPPRERAQYLGARGKVVRAYVRFLAAASGGLLQRRPDQTPLEIASQLAAAGAPLARLTALFGGARYGPSDPSDADANEAEALSGTLLGWLEKRSESAKDATARRRT